MNTLTIQQNGNNETDITINLDHPGALLSLLLLEDMHAYLPPHDPIRALLNALMYTVPITIVDSTDLDPDCGYRSMKTVQRNADHSLEIYGSRPRATEDDSFFKASWAAYKARRKIKAAMQREAIKKLTRLTDNLRTAIEKNCGCVTDSVRAEYESKALLHIYVLKRWGLSDWADLKKLILGDSYYA